MGWFKSKTEKELDEKILKIERNLSNNYKDAAQIDLKNYEAALQEALAEGKLKEKSRIFYEEQLAHYQTQMKGYTHKDQKPYWTKD